MSNTFKYGLLASLGFIAYELIAWQTGLNSHHISLGYGLGYVTILIPIVILFVALRERRKSQAGWLKLREGVGTSFRVGLVMVIFTTLFMAIYITQLQPDYMEVRREHERKMYFDQLKVAYPTWTDEHARDVAVMQFPDETQTRVLLAYALLKMSTALLVGLVLTLILRKEQAPSQPQRTDSKGTPISSSS